MCTESNQLIRPLLVIVPDQVSAIISKGEYQPRYYNPGNLFGEVHLLLCNDDNVDLDALQRTVGTARLFLHNLPEDNDHFIQRTRYFKPWLLQPWARPFLAIAQKYQFHLLNEWARPVIELARQIQPAMVRCHGNDYNAYVASRIKRELGIPYVVSLHINPDVNRRRRVLDPRASWQERLFAVFFDAIEIAGLRHADLALPVYLPIVPYLQRVKCERYEVAYNVLNADCLRKKDDYTLHQPVRLISVGRHIELKNPENIIRALHYLPNVQLTLVGDGEYQDRLHAVVQECGLGARVVFRPAIPNDELCATLPEYDIFVVHTEHWEISKAVLEALLTGMPTIINRRIGAPVPELQGDFVMLVENSVEGYRTALERLIADHAFREQLGRRAYAHVRERWAPEKTEAKYVEIYTRVIAQNSVKMKTDVCG
jgi:glycosyltransferase involved in cell wall biosynthesis